MDLFRDIAESLGASKSIPDEYYKKNIGVKITTWMIDIVPEENHHKIRDVFFSKNRDTAENHQFPIIEGTKETLSRIKGNNQKSCFISSKARASMDLAIKYYDLESILDFSISGDEVKNFKPDPEGIVKALKYFNAKPEEAIFVGDSLHDLGAARNANVRFVGVLSGICTKTDWEREKVPYVPSVKEIYT
jgi:phosphoglycolate phosphatase